MSDSDAELWFDPSDEDIDQLGLNDFVYPIVLDYDLPEAIINEIKAFVPAISKYPHRDRDARQAMADYVNVSADLVTPVSGVNGGLDLLAKTFLANKNVLAPTPVFWQVVEAPRRYGAKINFCSLTKTSEDQLIEKFLQNDAILLVSPNNPLGYSLTDNLIKRLLEVSNGRSIIIDESYADMAETSLIHLTNHPDLFIVRGFKVFLIPGARIGYIIAAKDKTLTLRRARMPFECNVLGEAAAVSVLDHIDNIRLIWKQVIADRKLFEERLLQFGGYMEKSETLFSCWRHPQAKLIGDQLKERNIITMYGEQSYIIYGMPDDLLRITSRKSVYQDILIDQLKEIL